MRHRIASADSRLGRKSPACCHRGSRGLPGLQAYWLPAPGGVFQISSFFLVRPGFGVRFEATNLKVTQSSDWGHSAAARSRLLSRRVRPRCDGGAHREQCCQRRQDSNPQYAVGGPLTIRPGLQPEQTVPACQRSAGSSSATALLSDMECRPHHYPKAKPSACWDSILDRKSTRLNSSYLVISYAVF